MVLKASGNISREHHEGIMSELDVYRGGPRGGDERSIAVGLLAFYSGVPQRRRYSLCLSPSDLPSPRSPFGLADAFNRFGLD